VEPGKRSELARELILILSRQKLQKKLKTTFLVEETELPVFLNELLKQNEIILCADNPEQIYLKKAKITFTRFVTISTIPTSDDVKKGYETGVAFNLKRNQQGADFLIPLKVDDDFTFWIIQIKNHNLKTTNSHFKADSTSRLRPEYVFEKSDLANTKTNYLAMYWQLGAHETHIKNVEWEVSDSVK